MTPNEHALACEQFRREPYDAHVRVTPTHDLDYATAGLKIDAAVHHLNEGIPGRQVERVRAAMRALMEGQRELAAWLHLNGWYEE